jgi:hypothetical protein
MRYAHQLCAIVILILTVLPFTEPFAAFDPNSLADSIVAPLRSGARGPGFRETDSSEWVKARLSRLSFGALPSSLALAILPYRTRHAIVAEPLALADPAATRCRVLRV